MILKAKYIPELTEKDKRRFWSKVDKKGTDECWEWIAGRFSSGYGSFSLQGKNYGSNRIAYFLEFRRFEERFFCLHSCDNPPCCNPSHLFTGTSQDNMDDMVKKGRSFRSIGELHGGSKLKEKQALDIIFRRKHGDSLKSIACLYNVSVASVSSIATGRNWVNLQG